MAVKVRQISDFYDSLSFKHEKRKKYNSLSFDIPCLNQQTPHIPQELILNICARFLLNIPQFERNNSIYVIFMCEEAYWFYQDFCLRDYENKQLILENTNKNNLTINEITTYKDDLEDLYSNLPKIQFKPFSFLILKASGLLSHILKHHNQEAIDFSANAFSILSKIIDRWRHFKSIIPVCGAIILDDTKNYVLLVKGYGSGKVHWGFPRGKIDEGEEEHLCACREVKEETGLDISNLIDEKLSITYQPFPKDPIKHQKYIKLFVVNGISKKAELLPRARYEIQEIKWFLLKDLYSFVKTTDDEFIITDSLSNDTFFQMKYFLKQLPSILKKDGATSFKPKVEGTFVKQKDISEIIFSGFNNSKNLNLSQNNVSNEYVTADQSFIEKLLGNTPTQTSEIKSNIEADVHKQQKIIKTSTPYQIKFRPNDFFKSICNEKADECKIQQNHRWFNFKFNVKPILEILQ